MFLLYGALAVGRRSGPDACSTVEARTVESAEGSSRLVLLVAIEGDLATPALEAVKGAFAKVIKAEESAALKLVSAAPPPPYASGVAVVILEGTRAFVATKGAARCYLERGEKADRPAKLETIAPGFYELAPGDAIVAASRAGLTTDRSFFEASIAPPTDDSFHNDGLDAALEKALSSGVSALLAVSAARVGS
jgi:hypothetical protein